MVESATGPLLLRKSKSLPTQKCHAPPAVAESSRLIDTVNPNNSVIFVENRSFQIVPKQEDTMNTLMSGTPIPLISVFIASFCFGTIWNDLFPTKMANLLGIDSIDKP